MSNNQPVGIPFQNPLRYLGPGQNIIPVKRFPRRPLPTDKKYRIGQYALLGKNPITGEEGELWYLSKFIQDGSASWERFTLDGIKYIETDDGSPPVVPTEEGAVKLRGGYGVVTSGQGPSTDATISVDESVVTTRYDADIGSAVPEAGIVNVIGSANIDTSASGNTIVVGSSEGESITIETDDGAPPVVPTGGGIIGVKGGVGIITSGQDPDTDVIIDVDGSSVTTQFNADVGSATPSNGEINVLGVGGIDTAAAGNTITINATGGFLQAVYASISTLVFCSTGIPWDDTIPQQTEGDEILTVTITPKSATSTLYVAFSGAIDLVQGGVFPSPVSATQALFQDDIQDALAATLLPSYSTGTLTWFGVSGSLATRTFKARVGPGTGGGTTTITVNGIGPLPAYGGVSSTTLVVHETA